MVFSFFRYARKNEHYVIFFVLHLSFRKTITNQLSSFSEKRSSQRAFSHYLTFAAFYGLSRAASPFLTLVLRLGHQSQTWPHYPEGSLFSDCEAGMPQLEVLSLDRSVLCTCIFQRHTLNIACNFIIFNYWAST